MSSLWRTNNRLKGTLALQNSVSPKNSLSSVFETVLPETVFGPFPTATWCPETRYTQFAITYLNNPIPHFTVPERGAQKGIGHFFLFRSPFGNHFFTFFDVFGPFFLHVPFCLPPFAAGVKIKDRYRYLGPSRKEGCK